MIRAEQLTRNFGRIKAVRNIDFHIKKGEIIGFLGPNGAGKSTTMNMITGYLAPTDGNIFIDGINLLESPEEARKLIGYLPEQPPLYLDLTVNEYLDFVSEFKKVPKSQRKNHLDSIRELVKLEEVQNRLIKNLSKGYRQRVGLAQALVGSPPLIILDEPTVGLDPKQIIEIRELIKNLGEEHTVVLSSHILPEISATCHRILIINNGEIVASDTPENLSGRLSGSTGALRQKVLIKGEVNQVKSVLEKIPSVASVDAGTGPEEGLTEAVVSAEENTDIREDVFRAMASADLPILQLGPLDLSLEEIFLNLTTSEEEA